MKKLIKIIAITLSSIFTFSCVNKPTPSEYFEYTTKTNLIFPLTGESLIGTGGRSVKQNPDHIFTKDQRFAIDIVALAPGSPPPVVENLAKKAISGELKLYQGEDFKNNTNHFCFARKIIAPGDGTVVDVKDGIYDNIPGEKNFKEIPGNYVVIDHHNGEFSMLAHFKKGSVLVKKGDKVMAGAPIGQCGNSGHSNLPHLHYHLQSTPRWHDGEGLPMQFQNYHANGKFVKRGETTQGEIISFSKRDV